MGAGMSMSSSDEAKTEKIESEASRELAAAKPDDAKMPVSSSDEAKAEKIESEASRKFAAAKRDEAKAEKIESESSRKLTAEKPEEAKTENGSPGREREGECQLCLFMKGGGCKESFIAWEKCIEDSENGKEKCIEDSENGEDDVEKKCLKVSAALIECMQAHFVYYEPILKLPKVMEAKLVAVRDSEQTKADDHP